MGIGSYLKHKIGIGKYKGHSYVMDEEDAFRLHAKKVELQLKALEHSKEKSTYLTEHAMGSLNKLRGQYHDAFTRYQAETDPKTKKILRRSLGRLEREIQYAGFHLSQPRSGLSKAHRQSVASVTTEAILFGLFLFSLVLMLSQPEITGFAVLNMPVIVNIPFVLGAVLFIINLILIERWFRRR